jgi:hypothetical protein
VITGGEFKIICNYFLLGVGLEESNASGFGSLEHSAAISLFDLHLSVSLIQILSLLDCVLAQFLGQHPILSLHTVVIVNDSIAAQSI